MLNPTVYVLACGAEFLSTPGEMLVSLLLDISGSEPVYFVKV